MDWHLLFICHDLSWCIILTESKSTEVTGCDYDSKECSNPETVPEEAEFAFPVALWLTSPCCVVQTDVDWLTAEVGMDGDGFTHI